nr:unnamed protein product [Callosobruchus analis]CAI5867306.1 unnamed protein product [Callosobruchus analis]
MTFCFFCEKDVSHFSRHLETWHSNEIEVQRVFSHESKSKGRRIALSALAKRGNYLNNRISDKLRPVKRVKCAALSTTNEFLPCPHCLGFYKRKSLYRHSRNCTSRTGLVTPKKQNIQSQGQTALLMGLFKYDELLKEELFPRMRADDITLTAKKDILICNYAYSYMKGRRSKGNLDLVRQNVRRLARLVLHAKDVSPDINDLLSLLSPMHFSIIVDGVNKIGGYNKHDDVYESPTVAINFGTLIKKCCDLAYIILLQKSETETQRKGLKTLKMLVESQWANEVSAQACANLNSKKWNKEQLLPLTSDLKKLKVYLEETAEKMFLDLNENEKNQEAYETLKEVLYSQIILMNRRRPAEVSQLKVQTYKSINLDMPENEFECCLTESEKILLNSCSRIVVRGKRGRGVPILLLSQQMRKHFDFLIEIRQNFVRDNDYVFHTTGKTFIDGTKTLCKYALKSGAENPKLITATRLRKHLATVTQLLQFSKSDLEQLSRFMGHTLKTHCDFYRLSDSMYQTAKISKLLLLASEGGLQKYKGMQLDDINIDLEPVVDDSDLNEQLLEEIGERRTAPTDEPSTTLSTVQSCKNTHIKQTWSAEQKKIIAEYFADYIKKKQAPKQFEVNKLIKQYPEMFASRKWTSIKAVVYNMYTEKLQIPK